MENFSKSILNYFATYNETRFRFNKKIPYAWSNDELTLDFSVFPEFERILLNSINNNQPFSLQISKDQYQVAIESENFKAQVLDAIDNSYNQKFLESCINQAQKQYTNEKFFTVNEEGIVTEDETDSELNGKIWREGCRIFNLSLRDETAKILLNVQEQKEAELQNELDFEHKPLSSFNPFAVEQAIFDDLQKIVGDCGEIEEYLTTVKAYIKEKEFELIMYDLQLMLVSFLQFVNNRTIFVFFHEIADHNISYPMYFIEISINNLGDEIVIENARDILMINTPAINSFKFENVLTTPRACQLRNSTLNLRSIEQFIQAYYKNSEEILLVHNFRKLVAENLPPIKYRLGIQLLEEDRKILDYSELITNLEAGSGKKFVDLVSNYVEGNVENTTDEIHREYKDNYPKKSVNNIIDDIPIKLNDSQKRVLLAAKNSKNNIIKIEGPPGTGKSYTICALVYLANLMNKSVLITSHKTQALDVVENMLTDQFTNLHPKAKPAVLRLTTKSNLGETTNNIRSTLSSSAINAASERALNFNEEAVEKDKNRLFEEIENEYVEYWERSDNYYQYLQKSFNLIQQEHDLFGKQLGLTKLPLDISLRELNVSRRQFSNFDFQQPIGWSQFKKLFSKKDDLDSIISKCDRLNKLQSKDIIDKTELDISDEYLNDLRAAIEKLNRHCVKDAQFRAFTFDSVDVNDIQANSHDFQISFSDTLKVKQLLDNITQANKGLISKIFGNSEKTELENTLKKDYPSIFNAVQEQSLEKISENLSKTIDKTKACQEKYPFLNKDYLLVNHKTVPIQKLQENYEKLHSLKFHNLLSTIANLSHKYETELTLELIGYYLDKIEISKEYWDTKAEVDEVRSLLQLEEDDLHKIYLVLQDAKKVINAFDETFIKKTDILIEYYSQALLPLGIETKEINSLVTLSKSDKTINKFWQLVELHENVSHHQIASPPEQEKIAQFEEKVHKLLEHQNDQRFKNFNKFSGDIQRALTAFNTGKRLSSEQAKMLFSNLSCVIASPKLVSEYLPMDKDMVDILIIDEASQVSIAESISLMLRAKQTIVFGDELQYGAVSAVNVSKKYSMRYFRDILDNYEKDKNDAISDSEKDRLVAEVSEEIPEEELTSSPVYTVDPNQKEWLKTFGIRTSTLSFAEAMANYKTSLDVHFRSFPEIISYSKEKFYKENQINLIINRIRTKPIDQVLRFIKVEPQGFAGKNVNLDEIEVIKADLEKLLTDGFKGTIGIICSFREQANRMETILREELSDYYRLARDHALEVWFVGDVQGVERDIVYYSLVEDKELGNGSLKYIYPVVGGRADNIHNLQKQRLNVGFSRAKDTMVFVHSMPLEKYADTSLGEALNHYQHIAQTTSDVYVEDEDVFGSPAEKKLYRLITQTDFFSKNHNNLRLIPQFDIGKYINDRYHKYIPHYRVDFLLTLSVGGEERSLIIEYDGIEYHYKNPKAVTRYNFDQEYIEYDIQRQLELEQYGYSFLRINKFNLMPENKDQTEVDVLDQMLSKSFISR